MARLHLALLGPLQASLDGQAITSFGYDKVRALLAYLAVQDRRPHERATLATLLWPGEPTDVARKNLRTALATLRQAIDDAAAAPPFLVITREAVQFNATSCYELDVATFAALLNEVEQHIHHGGVLCALCAARLAQAAELYRGEFVQQIVVPGSVAWEEWVMLARERLHRQMLDALAQLIAYHERHGQDDQARQYAWRTLALEPWDEAAHRCLMRVFARSGQRNAALAQYERCRSVLADELGITPSSETSALYERIRTKAPLPTSVASDTASRVVGATLPHTLPYISPSLPDEIQLP